MEEKEKYCSLKLFSTYMPGLLYSLLFAGAFIAAFAGTVSAILLFGVMAK
jgi:hypothetical protein